MPRFSHGQSDLARSQDAAKLAMRKERNISGQRTQTREESIGAVGSLYGHFSVGATIPIYIPIRTLVEDIQGAPTFVIAIIPFGQVGFIVRGFIQPDQRTGLQRTLERTG